MQPVADLLRRESHRGEPQNVHFAARQTARIARPPTCGGDGLAVSRGGQNRPAGARFEQPE